LTNSSLASILFASAGFGGGCSAGAYQQIVKNMQKFFFILTNIPQSFFNHTGNPISRKSLGRMQPSGQ
jgi:hypothetical protein